MSLRCRQAKPPAIRTPPGVVSRLNIRRPRAPLNSNRGGGGNLDQRRQRRKKIALTTRVRWGRGLFAGVSGLTIEWASVAPAGTEIRIALNLQERTEPKLGSRKAREPRCGHTRNRAAAQVLTDVVTSGCPQRGRDKMWSRLAARSTRARRHPVWRGIHEVCRHSDSQGSPR